jgi:hypothetical protein
MTDTRTITETEFVEALNAVVGERGGDWAYPSINKSCHYRWDTQDVDAGACSEEQVGQPACIVGAVFDKWGLLDTLAPPIDLNDGSAWFSRNDEGIADITFALAEDGVILPRPVQVAINRAQQVQDRNQRWEDARTQALAALEEAR